MTYPDKERATDPSLLERLPASRSLGFEPEENRQWRHAFADFAARVWPVIAGIINDPEGGLTERQRQILFLYIIRRMPQKDIARCMGVKQCTVSRHLYGVKRNGKKVGGAVAKLRKICCGSDPPPEVEEALKGLARARAR
ncbi:MAG: hypothetical protein GWP08_06255 [Nitrospiraceae bacterium]|nr:hypothetical protein [Nitrospiraceae bacterium]